MTHDEKVYEDIFSTVYDKTSKMFRQNKNPEYLETGVKYIISIAGGHTNGETIEIMIRLLDKLVANNIVCAR